MLQTEKFNRLFFIGRLSFHLWSLMSNARPIVLPIADTVSQKRVNAVKSGRDFSQTKKKKPAEQTQERILSPNGK